MSAACSARAVALRAGDATSAGALVAGLDSRLRSGPSSQRVRAWYGEALGRLATGDRPGAFSALRAGLAVSQDHRATLGATELRVRTATTVSELADLGLDLAIASGRALQVLRWSERWRAGALLSPRATPPNDRRLASLLSGLRDTVARLERATATGQDTLGLVGQQRRIEAAIRQHTRAVQGDFALAPRFPLAAELREALAERVLVEYIEHEGHLHAVIGDRERFRLRSLGSAAIGEEERLTLQFALGRLTRRRSSAASLEAAAALLERSCRRLSALLLDPIVREIDGRDLVVVPTGTLHALPWALLAPLRGRTVAVSPSVSLWYARQYRGHGGPGLSQGAGAVLVAAPRVEHAEEEVDRIAEAFYPQAAVLKGQQATVRAVARAFEGRWLAHVAAHGSFRADNPQFSSLEVADGPLTVYDIERITRPPQWIVLSACDAGRSAVHPGDELMGTSAALLSLGARGIVASAAPVPGDGVSAVMVDLHRQLARGACLAQALAIAQSHALPPELCFSDLASGEARAREALAACAFVCLGAG